MLTRDSNLVSAKAAAQILGINMHYLYVLNKQKPSARAIKAFKEVAGISLEVADEKNWVPSRDEIRFLGEIDR